MKNVKCLSLLGLVLLLVGCGPPTGTVSGTVSVDGKPVPGLEVNFEPVENGPTSVGYTNETGAYALQAPGRTDAVPAGDYVVRIVGGEVEDGPSIKVPAAYNTESDLNRTVDSGDNTFDFEIKSP